MSDGDPPKNWKEAWPVLVWTVLVFAAGFETISCLVHAEWFSALASFIIFVGLTAMLIHWREIKNWTSKISPNLVIAVICTLLIIISWHPSSSPLPANTPPQASAPIDSQPPANGLPTLYSTLPPDVPCIDLGDSDGTSFLNLNVACKISAKGAKDFMYDGGNVWLPQQPAPLAAPENSKNNNSESNQPTIDKSNSIGDIGTNNGIVNQGNGNTIIQNINPEDPSGLYQGDHNVGDARGHYKIDQSKGTIAFDVVNLKTPWIKKSHLGMII